VSSCSQALQQQPDESRMRHRGKEGRKEVLDAEPASMAEEDESPLRSHGLPNYNGPSEEEEEEEEAISLSLIFPQRDMYT
jgi:hypothetical protein